MELSEGESLALGLLLLVVASKSLRINIVSSPCAQGRYFSQPGKGPCGWRMEEQFYDFQLVVMIYTKEHGRINNPRRTIKRQPFDWGLKSRGVREMHPTYKRFSTSLAK